VNPDASYIHEAILVAVHHECGSALGVKFLEF